MGQNNTEFLKIEIQWMRFLEPPYPRPPDSCRVLVFGATKQCAICDRISSEQVTNSKEGRILSEQNQRLVKMAFSVEILKNLYCDLDNREWDEACESCEMPTLLHIGEIICTKKSVSEIDVVWSIFREIMKPIRKWYRTKTERMQRDSNFLQGLKEHEQKDHEWKCYLCKKTICRYKGVERI